MKNNFRKIILILTVSFSLLLTGCIEIVEEVTVNHDRSGTLSLSVNAGKENPLMALLGNFADLSFMDEMKDQAELVGSKLRMQEGISNVKIKTGKWSGALELSFDFENSRQLNEALYAVADQQKTIFQPNIYKLKHNKFIRKNTTTWLKLLLKQEKENLPDEALLDLVEMKSVYHLPEPVKKVSANCEYHISNDKQTVTLKNYVSDMLDEKINTGVKIRY